MNRKSGNINNRACEINMHYEQYERSYFLSSYYRWILKKCVRIANVNSEMTVLDYGCGNKILLQYLPVGIDYIGYDIISSFSDVTNIKEKKYNVIFAIQVLQYINNQGLSELMSNFSKLCDRLIIMCPTQNHVKRFIDKLIGLKQNNMIFKSTIDDIYKFANKYYSLQNRQSVLYFGEISCWEINT